MKNLLLSIIFLLSIFLESGVVHYAYKIICIDLAFLPKLSYMTIVGIMIIIRVIANNYFYVLTDFSDEILEENNGEI